MESLRSKDFADFCKRHLFKFSPQLSQPQKEGGCLCVGAKIPAPVMSSFARWRFLGFLITTSIVFVGDSEFFVIDSGKVITRRRCSMAVTLAVVQMEDFYTLSPDDENAHAEFSF